MLQRQIRYNRIWQCMADSAFEDALDGWLQALSLYERNRNLKSELLAAERVYNEIGDEASFYRMTDIRAEISREEGTEALIEGFGLPSGRAAQSF